ncbi:MAG: hypothetical protein DRN71_03410 [Candidatus Nanohalarchaeota archaeon]|nr:MAG: hypothetical protein DRN71_03410 [Candidatus Nanohaloarchaeota archaeon]
MRFSVFCTALVLFGVLALAGIALADAQVSAERAVPEFVDPDTAFEVVIQVNDAPETYVLYERIPVGFEVESAEPAYIDFNEGTGIIKWVCTPGGDHIYTYSLIGHNPGTYAFNGNIVVMEDSFGVEGNIIVKVRDNCTESWVCGYWSKCVDRVQTKTCRDENNCLFPEHVPLMEQSCSVDEDAVDEKEDVPKDEATADTEEVHVAEIEDDVISNNADEDHVADEVTADDDKIVPVEGEDESKHVEDERITGHATAIEDTEIKDSPAGNEIVGIDEPGNLDDREDIAKMPLFTKVLGLILVVEIMLLIIIRK